ncbi:39S ribosomal protein L22 [Tropilaelaps mercedesae]|uniref:Large ribosomal subunit protein uL22m n=1 Tax=Tropilaelaps mercedesae TaxID=418985 RepID=A0A1V9XBZ4_9ACAR|nr:39S ribosomal protein L22 [Tropilaelaps mercedesae]
MRTTQRSHFDYWCARDVSSLRMLAFRARGLTSVVRGFHTSPTFANIYDEVLPKATWWEKKNTVIHSPEEPVNRYLVHYRSQVNYAMKKMLPITWKIRGLTIDDAIAQMEFDNRKGAKILKEILKEAQDLAVKEHNIEFRSNLWVAEAFTTTGNCLKGIRKHSRARFGEIKYRYSNVFVRLEEGSRPKHYYDPPLTAEQKLKQFSKELGDRYVMYSI